MVARKIFLFFAQIIILFAVIKAAAVNVLDEEQLATVQAKSDFNNLRDQIAAQFYSEYSPERLKIITDSLGCKTSDCPQLLSASNIEYNALEMVGRRYIGRADRQQKIVIQSTDTELTNASPTQQNVTTVNYSMKCVETYESTITKTLQLRTEQTINLLFYKKTKVHVFTLFKDVERVSEITERTVNFPAQNVTVAPLTKMAVTFNFFQYDDINNYFIDFQIAENSTFSYLDVVDNVVVFVKKPLGDFLQKNIDFISKIKYEDDTMLKLDANDGKFILRNFPTTEKLSNFGVDVAFSKVTSLKEEENL